MKKISFLLIATFIVIGSINAQKKSKIEKILTSKQKWTVMDVNSKTPYFEIGENFTIRIDGEFYHDRNNYAKLGGNWTLDKKQLILTYDSFTEERRRIPFVYKVKKWGKDGFMLKYRNKFGRKERVYLK